ncbi:hypothetical protein [Rudanella lutea]|uniref:hypothetical protein n=1 Tax=Rudanella lutea TaxID=451374 RepID=UPI0003AA8BE8|nr:hypothetical protein [Rudanella lutea]
MRTQFSTKPGFPAPPLYQDILEFIDAMGIKQVKAMEAFGVSRSHWFKLKREHMYGLTIENINRFATTYNLPPEKVFALCQMTYMRRLSDTTAPSVADTGLGTTPSATPIIIDADFPPII